MTMSHSSLEKIVSLGLRLWITGVHTVREVKKALSLHADLSNRSNPTTAPKHQESKPKGPDSPTKAEVLSQERKKP